MYPTRVVLRPASGHRVAKASPSLCRGLSTALYPSTPFWNAPRHSPGPFSAQSDLAPFFRMLDDTTRAFDAWPSLFSNANGQSTPVWQPRFDVRERDDAFELRGDLPGVEADKLDVQFTDATTLVIRGLTDSERTEGQGPQAVATGDQTAHGVANDATAAATATEQQDQDNASVHSDSSYVQPTVEDDAPETASTLAGNATPAESTTNAVKTAATEEKAEESKPKFWISERRTGQFQRTFTFGQRIDQDGVTASLKNGILSVTVPKAAVPEPKRISVQ